MTVSDLVRKWGSEERAAMAIAEGKELHPSGSEWMEWPETFRTYILYWQLRRLTQHAGIYQ